MMSSRHNFQYPLKNGISTLRQDIVAQLRNYEETLAIADASTYGILTHGFISIPGASKAIAGSFICPSPLTIERMLEIPPEILEQHTLLSPETATAMAISAGEKLLSHHALALISSPALQGKTSQIQTTIAAISTPNGVWIKTIQLPDQSANSLPQLVTQILTWLLQTLQAHHPQK